MYQLFYTKYDKIVVLFIFEKTESIWQENSCKGEVFIGRTLFIYVHVDIDEGNLYPPEVRTGT